MPIAHKIARERNLLHKSILLMSSRGLRSPSASMIKQKNDQENEIQFPFSSNQSKTYAKTLEKAIFDKWSQKFVQAMPLPLRGEKVLDVACGTGATARVIASILGSDDSFSEVSFRFLRRVIVMRAMGEFYGLER